jgi:putative FmdB family regulatory protein
MRLFLLDFECTECKHSFETLVDLDTDNDPVCPKCQAPSKQIIGNPKHHKHVSHSSWRIGHGS